MATESPSTPNAGAINPAIARPSAAMAAALVALLAAGFALRLWNLDLLSFWWDEAYTIETVRHDLGTFWELQIASTHPPSTFWPPAFGATSPVGASIRSAFCRWHRPWPAWP